jgi:hypothetical protein
MKNIRKISLSFSALRNKDPYKHISEACLVLLKI